MFLAMDLLVADEVVTSRFRTKPIMTFACAGGTTEPHGLVVFALAVAQTGGRTDLRVARIESVFEAILLREATGKIRRLPF